MIRKYYEFAGFETGAANTRDVYFEGRIYTRTNRPVNYEFSNMPDYRTWVHESYKKYLDTLPSVELVGPHSFTNGQEVVEGKDYEISYEINKGDSINQNWVSATKLVYDNRVALYRRIVAIPIELPEGKEGPELNIKMQCEEMYRQIKHAEERLKELRGMCKHEQTFKGNYSYRVGVIMPAIICSDCGKLIKYL